MSSKFSSWLLVWALAGTLGSLTGCGGGGTEVASNTTTSATPPPATPPAAQQPPTSQEEEKTPEKKTEVSYGGETTSSDASAGSAGGGGGGRGGMMGGNMGYGEEDGSEGSGAPGMSSMGPGGSGSGMGAPGMSSMGPGGSGSGMGAPGMSSMGPGGSGSSGYPGMSGAPGAGSSSDYGSEDDGGSDMMGSPGSPGGSMGGPGGAMGGPGGTMGGPGGFGGQADSGFGMVSAFIRQNCANCHSGANAKGGVKLDRMNADIASDKQTWLSVVDALESGAMPPRSARQPDPRRKAMVIEFIRETLGSSAEATFMERAEAAFRKGDIDKANRLYYAQLVTADESEVSGLADHIKFYRPSVAKPEDLTPTSEFGVAVKPKLTTQLNFGLGIILKLSGQVTDVMPVGSKQMGGASGGEMGGMDGGLRGGPGRGGSGSSNSKLETFEDLTGEVGSSILSAFNSRRSSGNYGTLFGSLVDDSDAEKPAQAGMDGSGFDGGDSEGGMSGPGMGMGGPGGPGMGMGMGPGMGMGSGDNGAQGSKKTRPGKDLANGLLYIGKADNINSLLKKGVEAGVDGVFVIEIEASKNLRNVVTNETRVKFMLPSGKVVASGSKTLKNTDIEKAIAMGKDADDVQKHIDQLFNRLDVVLKLNDMPQISATAALKQLHSRIHSDADRLQVLAEARMFNAKGLISSEQLEMVYQVVLEGNEGTTLASGSAEDRKLVLTSFTEEL